MVIQLPEEDNDLKDMQVEDSILSSGHENTVSLASANNSPNNNRSRQ